MQACICFDLTFLLYCCKDDFYFITCDLAGEGEQQIIYIMSD